MVTTETVTRSRPASGITISPEQLTRWRDLRALSREDLAERTGTVLFDYARFPRILVGEVAPDGQMARALWLALDVRPDQILPGIPPVQLSPTGSWLVAETGLALSKWLRRNTGWSLDRAAVSEFQREYIWTRDELAAAVAKHWFSRDSVAKIERGERRPKARTLRAFCQILDCNPPDLMPGSDPLPDGHTKEHRVLLNYNAAMRAWADNQDPPVSYRAPGKNGKPGRIRYPKELQDRYAAWRAEREDALAS